MLCSKCLHHNQHTSRVRYTPTYYHHPIFQPSPVQYPQNTKCTATYHSTVFNQQYPTNKNSKHLNQGHHVKNSCNQIHQNQGQGCIHQQQISLNPKCAAKLEKAGNPNPVTHHTVLWYDQQKQVQLKQCSGGDYKNLSKDRKLLEMSSCAFYGNSSNDHIKNQQVPREGENKQTAQVWLQENEQAGEVRVQEKIENEINNKETKPQIEEQIEVKQPFEQKQQHQTNIWKRTQPAYLTKTTQNHQKLNQTSRHPQQNQKSFQSSKVNCLNSTAPKITGKKNTKITHVMSKRQQPVFKSVAVPRTR